MPRVWLDTLFDSDVASGAQSITSLVLDWDRTELRSTQMTLLRTIVGLDLGYTVHDAGEGSQAISIGIGITSLEAFTAGVIPDPNVAIEYPVRGWIWRYKCRVFGFAADQPAVFTRRIDIDLRAMRKLENGVCYMTVNNDPVEGVASAIRRVGLVRQLWLVG